MALGRGCPYKERCREFANGAITLKNTYCNNDLNWSRCAYTPGNAGNKQAEHEMREFKKADANGSILAFIIVAAAIAFVYFKFFA